MVLSAFVEDQVGVIQLTDYKPKPIKPKTVTYEHAGQKYTCRFDPNAPEGQQWVWVVDFVRVYQTIGSAPSLEAASKKARLHIHNMVKRVMTAEERDG